MKTEVYDIRGNHILGCQLNEQVLSLGSYIIREWNDAGKLVREGSVVNGCYHSPDGPAFRKWNDAGILICEEYYIRDMRHNSKGPALRKWNDAGTLICEEYLVDHLNHNPDGPARREWNDAGILIREEYWVDGQLHNPHGPAIFMWCEGKPCYVEYRVHGKLHNYFGPAILRYTSTGQVARKYYYLNGEELKEDQWRGLAKPPEILAIIANLHMPIAKAIVEYYCSA